MLFYSKALQARMDYMIDVRNAVWAEGKDLEKYINDLA
jgi:hypothetical protein